MPTAIDELLLGEIRLAARALREGKNVVFPTETVYGLGADALNAEAVARIFEIKGRPHFNPLIVHIGTFDEISTITKNVPPEARTLLETFWPGPLTLVLPKHASVPDLVTAGLDTIAVRMPNHPIALALLQTAKIPIAAPSANLFTKISPTCRQHIAQEIVDEVEWVIDGGPCFIGLESTIIGWVDEEPVVLRSGGLAIEQIELTLKKTVRLFQPKTEDEKVLAPGMLSRHYSPSTPSFWAHATPTLDAKRLGLLCFTAPKQRERFALVETLSPEGNLNRAAQELFAALRRLDAGGLDAILFERFPDIGLGVAINDRLSRAVAV